MIRQYLSVKEKHRDAILLYRLGDFYEMFFDDAREASKALDLTLTSRNKNSDDAVPLCGIPVVAAQNYISRLLSLGHKVAICEQLEDPKFAKGIVKRDVVKVLTPGVVFDPECLSGKENNFLAAVFPDGGGFGLATCDVSTGSFRLSEFENASFLKDEILRLEPREILLHENLKGEGWVEAIRSSLPSLRLNFLGGWHFDADFSRDFYVKFFQADLPVLGLSGRERLSRAGGVLLAYLAEAKILREGLLVRPEIVETSRFMVLDCAAKKNLELVRTQTEGGFDGSLLWLLDRTETSMGSRLLREWLHHPLLDISAIELRLSAVAELKANPELLGSIRGSLISIPDLPRIINRVVAEEGTARDLISLADSSNVIPSLLEALSGVLSPLLSLLRGGLDPLTDIGEKITGTLVDSPPLPLKEGGLIRDGVMAELDCLRDIERNGKSTISAMEASERASTGISSLKIRYNQVFGYTIEVTHTHREKIPSHYIRRQTLSNVERFITPELKEYEDKVLGAGERGRELEYEIFCRLRGEVASAAERVRKTAEALSTLDALTALADLARERNYSRPRIVGEPILEIRKGRHPVVEVLYREEPFVPNDLSINGTDRRLILITGPNMAGKSTVMRQAALITLMAQIGSFVPAEEAVVGIADRIFTRIGASDFLQKGQSTFMVEMLETAAILHQATPKSLILLDEIGRGTSTFDGVAIAWAVCETIHDKIRARTLFATHYHELTDLSATAEGLKNYQMAVAESGGEIRFLRELREGGTNRSYGVQVASMAGLPRETVARAREILKLLEEKDLAFSSSAKKGGDPQPSLFEPDPRTESLLNEIKNLPLDSLTPLEALNFLARIKQDL